MSLEEKHVQHLSPPEPDLTAAELCARAETIAPRLVARQAETEERTFYAADTHEEFREAGFYRMLVPRRYGGYEFGMETFVRVVRSIARGCPSTGWMLALGTQHAVVVATHFEERAQDEIFSQGDMICPGTTPPTGTMRRADDGGWTLNGRWAFCSGAPYATHYLGHALFSEDPIETPTPSLFVAPRSQWERLDDWGSQLGLRGSGSHSIAIENGHLAAHLALPGTSLLTADASGATPGLRLHGNPLYAAPAPGLLSLQVAALAVGMAQGALDAYHEIVTAKTTYRPPRMKRSESPDYHHWYGRATGMVATAEAATMQLAREWTTLLNRRVLDHYEDMRFVTMISEIRKLCWTAVEDSLFRTCGSTSVNSGERIERIFRDMSTLQTHTGFLFLSDMAELEVGRIGLTER